MAEQTDWLQRQIEDLERYLPRAAGTPRSSPTPEERAEERRKGFELFEELFADRLYPPETPEVEEVEEVPERTPPPQEAEFQEALSPLNQPYRAKTPPKWLTHSMDRDQFRMETRPDWFSRFHDKAYPKSPFRPRSPPSPAYSPPFWDVSENLELEPPGDKSSIFMSPRKHEPEPPLPELPEASHLQDSFEEALHRMHWELQKYEHDKEHIVHFVKMAPLLRDAEILKEELEALVKLYIPGVDADNMGPLVAFNALKDYIATTEQQIEERYEEVGSPMVPKYTGIAEEVLAAEVRLHKRKALEAIETYKRGYFLLLQELDKAEADLQRVLQETETDNATEIALRDEIKRLMTEEMQAAREYVADKVARHDQECGYSESLPASMERNFELKKLIPRTQMELERTREAHDREVKSMHTWVTMFPPNFVERITWLLTGRLTEHGYTPVPMEQYVTLIESMENDLLEMQRSRETTYDHLNDQCGHHTNLLNDLMQEIEEATRYKDELLEEQRILREELHGIRNEIQNRKELWEKLREEYVYYKDYNEMLLGKLIALRADASLRSEGSPKWLGAKSRSPSPVASPPSETFNVTQIESAPRLDGHRNEELSPFEMPDFSDISGSGVSDGYDSSPTGQAQFDDLGEEHPPTGMQDISNLSGSGGSPVYKSSPTGEAQFDLDEERPPSGMLDISDLSGMGGSPVYESSPVGQAQSENLDDERPPSEMLDFSGLQGGESFLEDSESSGKKTVIIPSPDKTEQLRMDVEIVPQDIKRSPSGQKVVCDVAVRMQEAAVRPPRRIEKRYRVVRGSPPISQTVGRRVDRRHGMFTPSSIIRRGYVGVRRPLFAGDFESPEPPFGTGRKTHPELMNLPERPPSPRPPRLDTTIEWENPEMNKTFR